MPALLEVSDVTVRFGGVTAVCRAELTADAGQVTGLIGPNGAGKTTLFNVLSGLQDPASGRVLFDGADVTTKPPHRRAKSGMARTFQRLEAFGSLSVFDNVRVAVETHSGWRLRPRAVAAKAEQLVERVRLHRFLHHQADSIPTGATRLLELARALAIEPKLLLLDEPSSGLDEDETDDFGTLLRELATEGRGILMVEHDMDLVMTACDRIHVLDFGKVIASGTPEQIRNDQRVQEAYLGPPPPELHANEVLAT